MSYTRLAKRPLIFRSFLGLTIPEFDFIYNELESKYDEHERTKLLSKMNNRKRSMGAGRPFKLKVKERLLIFLVYYRLYITFILSGFLFDIDQSSVCRNLSSLEHFLALKVVNHNYQNN
jgi:Helix-turn-helix of DDE superfamily endonuclease